VHLPDAGQSRWSSFIEGIPARLSLRVIVWLQALAANQGGINHVVVFDK